VLVTLSDVKSQLNIPLTDTTQDVELGGFIAAATEVVEWITGPVTPKVIVGEVYDGGSHYIMLRNPPILTVDSVTEYIGTTAYAITAQPLGSTVDNYGYSLDDPASGRLTRRSGAGTPMRWMGGHSSVVVNYTAGRLVVPASVRMAALLDIQDVFQKSQQGGKDQSGDDAWGGMPAMFPRLRSELEPTQRVVGIA
jgi:hypothetical protein